MVNALQDNGFDSLNTSKTQHNFDDTTKVRCMERGMERYLHAGWFMCYIGYHSRDQDYSSAISGLDCGDGCILTATYLAWY